MLRSQAICMMMLLLLAAASAARGAEWFVGLHGDDGHAGTSAQAAFATMQRACAAARAGDLITVLDGVYEGQNSWKLTAAGKPGRPVTYRAEHQGKVLIHTKAPGTWYQDALTVAANYIVIDGFDLQTDSYGCGVWIDAHHHVTVRRCNAHDCGGAGIGAQASDYLTIEDNQACRDAWTSPYDTSGISVYHPVAPVETDVGAPGTRIFVRKNVCWGNENRVGWQGKPMSAATDGNGIIIDDFSNRWGDAFPDNGKWPQELVGKKLPAYTHGAVVEGNLCFDNGGRGIHVLNSPHVSVLYNTLVLNCRNDLDGSWQGELSAQASDDFRAACNIVYAGNWGAGRQPVALANPYEHDKMHATFEHNLVYVAGGRHVAGRPWVFVPTAEYATVRDVVEKDPAFVRISVDPQAADFHLRAGSPAPGWGAYAHRADATK